MYLAQNASHCSTNYLEFSLYLDQKLRECALNIEKQAKEKEHISNVQVNTKKEMEEHEKVAPEVVHVKVSRPFDKSLAAIEANEWLEFCMWLVVLSIEAYEALRPFLKTLQPNRNTKAALSQLRGELGRIFRFNAHVYSAMQSA